MTSFDLTHNHKGTRYQYLEGKMYIDIADIIKNKLLAKKILDVGCFKGNLLKHLYKIKKYIGIEISEEFDEICYKNSKEKKFKSIIFYGDLGNAKEPSPLSEK